MLALKIKRREAVGIVGCLSSWAIQYRPGGRIEAKHIAVAVEWEGSNIDLVAALVEVGWLDQIDKEWVQIHDWKDITRGYKKARTDATRKAKERDQNRKNLSTDSPRTEARSSVDIQRPAPRSDLIGSDLNRADLIRTRGTDEDPRAHVDDAPQLPPQLRSGSNEHQLTAEWNRGRGWPIAADKGARLVRCAIDAGADAQKIQADFWDESKTKGRKIWQVLESHIPSESEAKLKQLMAWAKEFDTNGKGGSHGS
jgi:hypothetical protein